MKVYFIGAGPGDPELLTIKAKNIIGRADIIIYAGSLVNRDILKLAARRVSAYDSSKMTLKEVLGIMQNAKSGKKVIARIHRGDTSINGPIQDQTAWCDKEKHPNEFSRGGLSLYRTVNRSIAAVDP